MDTMNVTFDELSAMAFEQRSSKPRFKERLLNTSVHDSILLMWSIVRCYNICSRCTMNLQTPNATTKTALMPKISSIEALAIPNTLQDVDELQEQQHHFQQQIKQPQLQPEAVADNVNNALFDENALINPFAPPSTSSAESSSQVCGSVEHAYVLSTVPS
ncbi:hypothetical protein Tco_0188231 [Tanacetum coccineum]